MDTSHISILIVDDEPLNQDIFSATLKKGGYLTQTAGNGNKALELLKLERFDMVLLDINMPGMTGTQLLEHLKSDSTTRDIPVIMVTAEHDNSTVLDCIKLGAADYIKKPIEPALLRSRVWRCLQKHRNLSGPEPDKPQEKQLIHAKILIVDDDEMHRAILQRRLTVENHAVLQANNGNEAITILENNKVDLILLDVIMPELDGFQTLEKIKACERNRHIPVLMCSADDSPQSIDKCLKAGADDYILKPYNAALLRERIQSCLLLDKNGSVKSSTQPNSPDIIMDLAERLKNDSIKFPVMPDIAIQIDQLFKENPDASVSDIAEIIKTDPALTMRLISISNSAHYRGATSIENLEEAIMRMGMKETQNYLLLLTARSMFDSDNPSFKKLLEALWVHSLATAQAARLLGKLVKYPDLDLLFTLGMLHDMGKLLLLQILIELDKNGRDMDEANIIEIVDTLHMAFGASLMRKWNMPNEFSYTAEQHHTIAEGGNYSQQFLIVCLANLISRKPGYSLKENNHDDFAQSYPARVLGIDADAISKVADELVPFINSVKGLS